jgi:hypothetical protein
MQLTERERLALEYMRDKMWTDPLRTGKAVLDGLSSRHRGGSNLPGIGAAVLGSLRKKGLAMKIMPEGLWRLTKDGRDKLATL